MRGIAAALVLALGLGLGLGARVASAQDLSAAPGAPPSAPIRADPDRPFLYLPDASPLAPGGVAFGYTVAVAQRGGAARPLPLTLRGATLLDTVALEVGLSERLSVSVAGSVTSLSGGQEGRGRPQAQVQASARLLLTDPRSAARVTLVGTAFRELAGDLGGALDAVASVEWGRVRLGASEHVERVFAPGRDPVDLYTVAGASVRVSGPVRLGVEYVAEDVEELFDDEQAEGGLRHFVGADAALTLARRWLLTFGPAFGLNAASPPFLGRAGLTYVF